MRSGHAGASTPAEAIEQAEPRFERDDQQAITSGSVRSIASLLLRPRCSTVEERQEPTMSTMPTSPSSKMLVSRRCRPANQTQTNAPPKASGSGSRDLACAGPYMRHERGVRASLARSESRDWARSRHRAMSRSGRALADALRAIRRAGAAPVLTVDVAVRRNLVEPFVRSRRRRDESPR